MATVAEIRKQALKLPDAERAQLAADLLESLPAATANDESVEEALVRTAELDRDPTFGCSWEELKQSLGR
ncbi:MAG: addiction module protein [Verrucomicrobiales bacterium]